MSSETKGSGFSQPLSNGLSLSAPDLSMHFLIKDWDERFNSDSGVVRVNK